MKIELTKKFTFEAAHFLEGYNGACGHVHGHSYKLELSVKSTVAATPEKFFELHLVENGQEVGMIVDSGRLKKCVQPVIDRFDHALIVESETRAYIQTEGRNVPVFAGEEPRVVVLGVRPTTENIAIALWRAIAPLLPAHVVISKLRLCETETLWVTLTNE